MDEKAIQAYDFLTPADQLVVDAVIITLYKRAKELEETVEAVKKFVEEKRG